MSSFDDYPYAIHTNRELEFMLSGIKPMAVFVHERVDGFSKSDALAGQDFSPYVAQGLISEHLEIVYATKPDGSRLQLDYYFYCLATEEWRIKAYLLMLETQRECGWSKQLEWQEGSLLGYSFEENRYHIQRRYS